MTAVGVIPARYDSTRFPGKPLAQLLGRPLIQYVYEEALKSSALEEVIVATDDERILQAVKNFGGRAVMTAKGHLSGTDRVSEVVNPIDTQIVVNIQADEPLLHFSMLNELVNCLLANPGIPMATLIHQIKDERELADPNVVKVVKDKNNFALYFSRSTVPNLREAPPESAPVKYYKHLGLYAYTKDFLFTFTNLPEGELEKSEKLEQLRALENGYKIKVIETGFETIGVDTAEDLEKVKARLAEIREDKGSIREDKGNEPKEAKTEAVEQPAGIEEVQQTQEETSQAGADQDQDSQEETLTNEQAPQETSEEAPQEASEVAQESIIKEAEEELPEDASDVSEDTGEFKQDE